MSEDFKFRLFTPSTVEIVVCDSLETLVTRFGEINNIYISDFQRCKSELKGVNLESLIEELELLSNEQVCNLKLTYNLSALLKNSALMLNVDETIHKLEKDYQSMISSLYLPL
jgi:hypothetical protein